MKPSQLQQAALAAHRFGLGEADLAVVGADAHGWLLAQIGAADSQRGSALPDLNQALTVQIEARRQGGAAGNLALRNLVQSDIRARLQTASSTQRPFAERLALFWCNHFTVSLGKGSTTGLVGAFEREAIRPHIAGRFADLLMAATSHPAMLRYLDNTQSAGPQSRIVQRLQYRGSPPPGAAQARDMAAPPPPRLTGLNENLARELLELHTLGVAGGGGAYGPWGGYGQADVTALAAVLTGWRGPRLGDVAARDGPREVFDANWHQPGAKAVLGRSYAEGPQALRQVVDDLSRHPSTARFIATKLVRHLVADQPPLPLVARVAERFSQSDGDLTAVYTALLDGAEAWQAQPAKLKTPEEFVISSARLMRLGERLTARAPDAGLAALGQRPHAASSPAGWSDHAADWLGPEAVWQRMEWSLQLAERMGGTLDARALAQASLGPLLGQTSQQQIERAANGAQALTLLMMAPEFQRR